MASSSRGRGRESEAPRRRRRLFAFPSPLHLRTSPRPFFLFPRPSLFSNLRATRERESREGISLWPGHSESLALGLGWPARPLFLPLPPNSVLASSKASSETQREAKEEGEGGKRTHSPLFSRLGWGGGSRRFSSSFLSNSFSLPPAPIAFQLTNDFLRRGGAATKNFFCLARRGEEKRGYSLRYAQVQLAVREKKKR